MEGGILMALTEKERQLVGLVGLGSALGGNCMP